jgi:hypothetical protein
VLRRERTWKTTNTHRIVHQETPVSATSRGNAKLMSFA